MAHWKRVTAAIAVALIGIGVFLAGRGCQQRAPESSEFGEKWLHYRPQEIDRRIVEAFELEFNGTDILQDHPAVVQGEPVHFTGRFAVKPDVLTVWESPTLTMGHRRLEQGQTDWTPHTKGFDELVISPEYNQGGLIDYANTLDLSAGEYEVRFFVLIKDVHMSRLPDVYHIARGKLTVLPAMEKENSPGAAPAK